MTISVLDVLKRAVEDSASCSASRREACIAVAAYVALVGVVGDFLRANPEGCGVYLGDDCVSRRARMADLGAAFARAGGEL